MQYENPMKYVNLQRPCCIVMHVPLIGSVSLCGMYIIPKHVVVAIMTLTCTDISGEGADSVHVLYSGKSSHLANVLIV